MGDWRIWLDIRQSVLTMKEIETLHEPNAKGGTKTTENLRLLGSVNNFPDTDGAVYTFIYH